jgi:hypothetical protein
MAALMMSCVALRADETNEVKLPAGMIDFKNADPRQVLDIYGKLSGLKLDIASNVPCCSPSIVYQTARPVTAVEALQGLEKALNEQAHIVITKTDDKHATVTVKIKDEKPADH